MPRFPANATAFAVFAVLVGKEDDRNILTFAGTGTRGAGHGRAATQAQLRYARGMAVDGAGNLYVAGKSHRIRVSRSAGERNPITQEFPQFANGDSTVADLVLVNVDTKTVTPAVRFCDSMGDPISADSVPLVSPALSRDLTCSPRTRRTQPCQPS